MRPTPARTPTTVAGEHVTLRGWTSADAAQVAAACSDPLIALWNPLTGSAADWCLARADWSDGTHASWAVVAATGPAGVLGSISLFHLDHVQETAEVGFWVSPPHRGHGVASAALQLASDYALTELGVSRVELFHAVENAGSCRTATTAGYALEGRHRASHRYGDGRWHDEHTHALLHARRLG